jgi:hypothetical protein
MAYWLTLLPSFPSNFEFSDFTLRKAIKPPTLVERGLTSMLMTHKELDMDEFRHSKTFIDVRILKKFTSIQ